jgi:predicted AAA+ superfamily ATPase
MISRYALSEILDSLTKFPIVSLVGPRQTGKTTLAKEIAGIFSRPTVYLDLELPSDAFKLQNPELYLDRLQDSLIIIDEIQRQPELFPLLRALVDRHRVPGRFLILGSASPTLAKHTSESLAGRIVSHELSPFSIAETGPETIERLWIRGGFPDSFLAASDNDSLAWRDAFITTYLERDIPQLGIRIPAAQLRRFWTMIAHCHGQLWNASAIASSMGLTAPTARHYLDILEQTFIVRQLQPYATNLGKRLIKSPKVYLRDSGLLHALLRIASLDELAGHPVVGHSWEGYIVEQLITRMPRGWQVYFYRSVTAAEIDLVFLDARQRTIAVEVKYSSSPAVPRGFWNALEDLKCEQAYVIYPGNDTYPLRPKVQVLPVKMMGEVFGIRG